MLQVCVCDGGSLSLQLQPMECLSWLVALSPLLEQGLAVVPSRSSRSVAGGEAAGQLRRQSQSLINLGLIWGKGQWQGKT